jgi:bacteriorhodopsin
MSNEPRGNLNGEMERVIVEQSKRRLSQVVFSVRELIEGLCKRNTVKWQFMQISTGFMFSMISTIIHIDTFKKYKFEKIKLQ